MPAIVLFSDHEVIPRLAQLHLPKEIMLDILDRGVGERATVNSYDPVTAGGYEMWRWVTRFCREDQRLKALDWVPCAHDQIEGIRNDKLGIKLVAVNTDGRTGILSKYPRNIAEKAPPLSG